MSEWTPGHEADEALRNHYRAWISARFDGEPPAQLADAAALEMFGTGNDPPSLWLCGDYRLEEDDALAAYMRRDVEALPEALRVILSDSDGNLYALWRDVPDAPWRDCPVVYLDAHGSGDGVVASSIGALLPLFAAGFEPASPQAIRGHVAGDEPLREDLRAHVAGVLGIPPADDPLRVLTEAEAAHPGFEAWWARVCDAPVI